MKKIIKVTDEIKQKKYALNEKIYLSDLVDEGIMRFSDLHNTVFNKAVTGIGGTSLALDAEENIIILMPFKEVVNNKEGYNKDTFIVKGGISVSNIEKYLLSTNRRKIVSTYDGLEKILTAYNKTGIDFSDDFLLIDEWQVMFKSYVFRHSVIRYILDNIKRFNKVCFMTATPIKKEWWFKEMKKLDELEIEYDIRTIRVNHFKVGNVVDETIAICKLYSLDKFNNNNAHIFCNSVEFIKKVCTVAELKPEEVRIICSDSNDKNRYKLSGFKIENTKDEVKKINFYTSTCFEGCDLFDKLGKIYVICDGKKSHTLVDISTTLPQIAGRIRDIQNNEIELIYSTSKYINITKEEFAESIERNKIEAKKYLESKEQDLWGKVIDIDEMNNYYLNVTKDNEGKYTFEFEETLLNLDQFNFEIHHIYSLKANISNELNKNFYPVNVIKPWAEQLSKIKNEKLHKLTFKDKINLYVESKQMLYDLPNDFDKDVIDAVEILGINEIKRLKYHKGHIKRKLITKSDLPHTNKIFKILSTHFKVGSTFKNEFIKEKIEEVYNILGIEKAATATQIENYYFVNKSELGYEIISPKIIFSNTSSNEISF